jgi:pimeloyl-ACP methyl ester carboxylesterase
MIHKTSLFAMAAALLSLSPGSVAFAAEAVTAPSFVAGTPANGTEFQRRQISDDHGGIIRFYLAPVAAGPRPLLLVIQGSGCEALFVRGKNGLSASAGQDIVQKMAAGRYVVAVVEKPDVMPESAARSDGTTAECSVAFNRDHALDPWTHTLSQAVDAALTDPSVDRRAGVRLMGLSEGAVVAAHLSAMRPDVTHVAFISGFGCDQWRDVLVVARRGAADAKAALAAVAEAQKGLAAVAADPTATDKQFDGQTHLFWSTFGRACPAADLSRSNASVYLAFGTADEEFDANGIEAIPAALIAGHRQVTIHRVYGGSHVLDTPGTSPFANLLGVFAEALDWMKPSR